LRSTKTANPSRPRDASLRKIPSKRSCSPRAASALISASTLPVFRRSRSIRKDRPAHRTRWQGRSAAYTETTGCADRHRGRRSGKVLFIYLGRFCPVGDRSKWVLLGLWESQHMHWPMYNLFLHQPHRTHLPIQFVFLCTRLCPYTSSSWIATISRVVTEPPHYHGKLGKRRK